MVNNKVFITKYRMMDVGPYAFSHILHHMLQTCSNILMVSNMVSQLNLVLIRMVKKKKKSEKEKKKGMPNCYDQDTIDETYIILREAKVPMKI